MWAEETLWKSLKRLTGLIAILPLIHQIESVIQRLPVSLTIVIFFLPMVSLFPLKILAVYWLARGHWLACFLLVAFAKVLGTALVARLYVVCQPKLMTLSWFRWGQEFLIGLRDNLYTRLKSLPIYQAARDYLMLIKQAARRLVTRTGRTRGLIDRWRAIRRWHRQKSKS